MQRLEVSCAVRRIYRSLGVKGLRKVCVDPSQCHCLRWLPVFEINLDVPLIKGTLHTDGSSRSSIKLSPFS